METEVLVEWEDLERFLENDEADVELFMTDDE